MGAFALLRGRRHLGARVILKILYLEVKDERLSQLMELQEKISLEIQEEKVDQMRVVIDREET